MLLLLRHSLFWAGGRDPKVFITLLLGLVFHFVSCFVLKRRYFLNALWLGSSTKHGVVHLFLIGKQRYR